MVPTDDAAGAPATAVKILVIDDDQLIRMACRNVLRKNDFHVIEAENGNQGIALFTQEKPALVITDMLMPDKEGLETITELRKMDPAVRIIAMSGGGATQNMSFLQMAQKLGAKNILNKPFKPDDLVRLVRETLAGS
ncbi:MAG: response regulator [Alphaproteobacteria bacterium]|nr:response regulator [Alphaproteobacteria bacterium]